MLPATHRMSWSVTAVIKLVQDVDSFFWFCVFSCDLNCTMCLQSHRQNKSLCLPRSRNWTVMEVELPSSLCKLTEIVSSIHFSQVLPCSLGRNCHCKESPILQKRHIWLEIEFSTRRPGWSLEKNSMRRIKLIFLSWNCNSVTWIPLGKDFSFPSFPAKILSLCACPN